METLHIIKIGGNIIDDPLALENFLKTFSAIKGPKILVHGGGKLATNLALQLGIPQTLVEGRRITDAETLKVVVMVYAGFVNKNIVAKLQAYACNALGVCGADGNLIIATKREHTDVDYGWVGDIIPAHVNTHLLQQLFSADLVPVIAPITHDRKGHLLNTNADTMTSVIASAMAAHYSVRLIYCFEKKGVLRDITEEDSIIPYLIKDEYQKLKQEGHISKGMIPKLDNAFDALYAGIEQVTICHAKHLQANGLKGIGTYLVRS